MLSPTWWEVTGADSTRTPAPMTLSRGDNDPDLYPPGQSSTTSPHRRAFWHPGIGVWQLDDISNEGGSQLSFGKFNTWDTARRVATTMSQRYCNSPTAYSVFGPWCACGSDGTCGAPDRSRCETTFNRIYNPNGPPEHPIEFDYSVDSYGGSDVRTCRWVGGTATFTCVYVNPALAQGYTGSWIGNPNGTIPLAKPFYVFKEDSSGTFFEWRYWMSSDTGFGSDYAARRRYGNNSRSGLFWIIDAAQTLQGLCDVTASRGACNPSCSVGTTATKAGCVPVCYSLTLTRNTASGGGIPTATPVRSQDCPTGQYIAGEPITLSAAPSSGWTIGSWNGTQNNSSTSTTNTVVMPAANHTAGVNYVQSAVSYTLTVSVSGPGTVGSSPAGIACPTDCAESYMAGTRVTLAGVPISGAAFTGWGGDSDCSDGVVDMTAARTCQATFTSSPTLPVVTVSAMDAIAREAGLETGAFRITRSGSTANPLGLAVSQSGTASYGNDYDPFLNSGAIIPAGNASLDLVVSPHQDTLVEGNETVTLTVNPQSTYVVGTPTAATVTIIDDDSANSGAPLVNTLPPTALGYTSGRLNGIVNPNGLPTTAWFEWGQNTLYGSDTQHQSVGAGSTQLSFLHPLSNIYCGAIYHYRAVATSAAGTNYGTDEILDLPECPADSSRRFFTVTPCRILDTRVGAPLQSGVQYAVSLGGPACAIPYSAKAVSANITVVGGTGYGFLTVWPADVARPGTSSINFSVGQTRGNNAVLGLDTRSGSVIIEPVVLNGGTVHVIIDVNGYFD